MYLMKKRTIVYAFWVSVVSGTPPGIPADHRGCPRSVRKKVVIVHPEAMVLALQHTSVAINCEKCDHAARYRDGGCLFPNRNQVAAEYLAWRRYDKLAA